MRYSSLFLIGTLVFIVSCSDDTVATGPTGPGTLARAAATVTNQVVVNEPFGLQGEFIPCADGGAGEFVDFTGFFSGTVHFTINGNRLAGHFNGLARLRGEGESTGDKYEFINAIQDAFSGSLVNGQFSETIAGNAAIIGQGAGNNLLLGPLTIHLTVNANGEVTAEVERFSFECR
jgi:hypothetical protein